MTELTGYNPGYLDEQTKRSIRRAILKAVAIPGYQVPFGGREMPMPYGWGTGGIQLTASVIGERDVLKVIDQGADDTTNAVSIRRFFQRVSGAQTTESTRHATLIQTRHRIPETPLTEDQILIFQVPIPEPLRFIEPRETETRNMHALEEYGIMQVKLYEDIARFGHIATTYAYPVKVNDRYVMDPSHTGYTSGAFGRLMRMDHPDLMKQIRIIWQSPLIPNGPILVSNKLPADFKPKLIAAIHKLDQEQHDCFVKAMGGKQHITPATVKDYDNIIALKRDLIKGGR